MIRVSLPPVARVGVASVLIVVGASVWFASSAHADAPGITLTVPVTEPGTLAVVNWSYDNGPSNIWPQTKFQETDYAVTGAGQVDVGALECGQLDLYFFPTGSGWSVPEHLLAPNNPTEHFAAAPAGWSTPYRQYQVNCAVATPSPTPTATVVPTPPSCVAGEALIGGTCTTCPPGTLPGQAGDDGNNHACQNDCPIAGDTPPCSTPTPTPTPAVAPPGGDLVGGPPATQKPVAVLADQPSARLADTGSHLNGMWAVIGILLLIVGGILLTVRWIERTPRYKRGLDK